MKYIYIYIYMYIYYIRDGKKWKDQGSMLKVPCLAAVIALYEV